MVKRVIVGAHYGLKDWLVQRVSALVMALYSVGFVALLAICPPQDFAQWRALFANQAMRVATAVFFLSLFWHSWVGMRDILMDYAKPTSVRLALEIAVVLVLIGYAVWAALILWSL